VNGPAIGPVLGALVPNVLSLVFILSGRMSLPALLVLMMLETMVVCAVCLRQPRRGRTKSDIGWGAAVGLAAVFGILVGMRAVEDTHWTWGTLLSIVLNIAVFIATLWWRHRQGTPTFFGGGEVLARFALLLFGVVVLLSWADTIRDLPSGWAARQHGAAWMSWFGWQVNRFVDGSGLPPMTAAALALFVVKALNDVTLTVRAVWLSDDGIFSGSTPTSDAVAARSTRSAAGRASVRRRRRGRTT